MLTSRRRMVAWGLALSLAACSSVEVPVERFYRLQPAQASPPDPLRAGTLRVHDLQLGTALDSDRLLCQSGVRLEARPLSRWVAPLDRMVTDAMVLGLSRSQVCKLVKGSVDSGRENWSLHGRIVDFVEAFDDPAAAANSGSSGRSAVRVTLELWLQQGDRLVFQGEFTAAEPLARSGPDEAVAGLSRCLNQIVASVVQRMRSLDLFAQAHRQEQAATNGRDGLAEPPR